MSRPDLGTIITALHDSEINVSATQMAGTDPKRSLVSSDRDGEKAPKADVCVIAAGSRSDRRRLDRRENERVPAWQPVADETTVCRFLLGGHDLGRRLFDEVQRHLATRGLKIATGTMTVGMRSTKS